jgi:ABC-type Fe3+/spermidine/putrescine transport system ATPase subunit
VSKLILRDVVKKYGETVAVDRISLSISEGEFVSLLGPSGCGKTTTLRMIAGFIRPTDGLIEMDGKTLSSASTSLPPERREMSMIFQSYAIWPNMTVAENVGFGLKIRKLPADEIRRRTGEILEVVQMGHLAGRYPAELSGGQQQRVALARAIVVKPAVLLLDEPLSNLDANLREEMRFEIRRLHDEFRITTVYVTHDQGEAMVTSDRIAVMNAGRIEQIDDPYTLYNRPKSEFVAGFIGRTNLLDARQKDGRVEFDGFALDANHFEQPDALKSASGELRFSVRPQTLRLHVATPGTPLSPWMVESAVVERAYLGETWDYVLSPKGSNLRLRVTTLPNQIHKVGDAIWVEFDPEQMVPLA